MIKSFAQIELDTTHQLIKWKDTRAYKIFEKLTIANYPRIVSRHLAQYVVIFLDLNLDRVHDPTTKTILDHLNQKIENIYDEYRWILNGDHDVEEEDIAYMKKVFKGTLKDDEKDQYLYRLSKIFYSALNGTKSIILVDDYDGPMTKLTFDEAIDTTQYYHLLNKMLSKVYTSDCTYVDYILITGTSSMPFYSDHSGHRINSEIISHHAFLEDHPLVSFCGILEKELTPVLDRRSFRKMDRYQMKECYNGYMTRLKRRSVYNSYSVRQYLSRSDCNVTEYWMQRYGDRNSIFYPRATNDDVTRYWSIENRDYVIFSFVYFSEFLNDISIPAHSDNRIETNFTFSKIYDENSYRRFGQLMKFISKFSSEEARQVARDRQSYLPVIRTFTFEHGYFTHSSIEGFYGIPNFEVKMEIIERIEKLASAMPYEY